MLISDVLVFHAFELGYKIGREQVAIRTLGEGMAYDASQGMTRRLQMQYGLP